MFGISQDVSDRNGNKPGRRWKDTYDEMALKAIMIKFNVLATKTTAASLLNIATKDGCHREYSRIFIEREIAWFISNRRFPRQQVDFNSKR